MEKKMIDTTFLEQVASGQIKLAPQSLPGDRQRQNENIAIIIDRSSSMGLSCGTTTRLEAAKEAAAALVSARRRLGAGDEIAVISFNHTAELACPLTPSTRESEILGAIQSIRMDGETDLNAPFVLVKDTVGSNRRRMLHIIMLTDGQGGSPLRTANALKKRGAVIETIGVGHTRSDVDEELLKKVASVVNKKVLYRFIYDRDDMVNYFETEIANRLVKWG